jgi:hypothetical protein
MLRIMEGVPYLRIWKSRSTGFVAVDFGEVPESCIY